VRFLHVCGLALLLSTPASVACSSLRYYNGIAVKSDGTVLVTFYREGYHGGSGVLVCRGDYVLECSESVIRFPPDTVRVDGHGTTERVALDALLDKQVIVHEHDGSTFTGTVVSTEGGLVVSRQGTRYLFRPGQIERVELVE